MLHPEMPMCHVRATVTSAVTEAAVAGVVLAGGIAVFLVGLAAGIVVANVFVPGRKDRRSRVAGKVRNLQAAGRARGLPARGVPGQGEPDGGP